MEIGKWGGNETSGYFPTNLIQTNKRESHNWYYFILRFKVFDNHSYNKDKF